MNNKPLVSVLLISMKHEKFIEQATYSILNQTYKNFEVFIIEPFSDIKSLSMKLSMPALRAQLTA